MARNSMWHKMHERQLQFRFCVQCVSTCRRCAHLVVLNFPIARATSRAPAPAPRYGCRRRRLRTHACASSRPRRAPRVGHVQSAVAMLRWQLVFQIVPDATRTCVWSGQHRVQVSALLEAAPPNLQAGRPSPAPPTSICSMQLSATLRVICVSRAGAGSEQCFRHRLSLCTRALARGSLRLQVARMFAACRLDRPGIHSTPSCGGDGSQSAEPSHNQAEGGATAPAREERDRVAWPERDEFAGP